MANEISYQIQALLTNGNLRDNYSSGSLAADQANAFLIRNVQTIGFAAAEALDLGDLTTPGITIFFNMDDTNFVEIGSDSGGFVPFMKLKPGEMGMCRLGTAAPQAKADTGAIDLFYIIYDD